MPQKLVGEIKSDIMLMQELDYGELAEIVVHTAYSGMIVTKAYDQYVAVYSPYNVYRAFHTTWDKEAAKSIRVRRLRGQQVILSNE